MNSIWFSSSKLSSTCLSDAREAVLSFFQAPPGYTVIFTANATAALKLVGESFPFNKGSSFVLGVDSHNSVHGIRQFAARKEADVCYIDSTRQGGFDPSTAKVNISYWPVPTNAVISLRRKFSHKIDLARPPTIHVFLP
jgi:molybdenum cofactor sulfurtransferase